MESNENISTRERIIRRSCYYYGMDGDNFSLSQVARDLDIRKQSIYSYYKSKDELLITVLNRLIDDYETQQIEVFDTFKDLPSKERLYHIGLSFITSNSETDHVWVRKWLGITCRKNAIIRQKVMSSAHNFEKFFDSIFKECIDEGLITHHSTETLSEIFIMFLRGIADSIVPSSTEKNIRLYDSMFNFVWASIEQ